MGFIFTRRVVHVYLCDMCLVWRCRRLCQALPVFKNETGIRCWCYSSFYRFWLTYFSRMPLFLAVGDVGSRISNFSEDGSWKNVWKILLAEMAYRYPPISEFFSPTCKIAHGVRLPLRAHSPDQVRSSVFLGTIPHYCFLPNSQSILHCSISRARISISTNGWTRANIQPQVVISGMGDRFRSYAAYGIERLWYIFIVLFRPPLWGS